MEKIISSIDLNPQIQWVIAIILSILVIATTTFWIWNKLNPSKLVNEMILRTKSWWGMCFIFLFASTVNPIVTYIGLAFLSFFTLFFKFEQRYFRKHLKKNQLIIAAAII